MPKCDIYRFEEHDGQYVITEKATLPGLPIERILGKVVIKKSIYEKVELKSLFVPEGVYLVKRKKLTFQTVKQFVTFYSDGTRCVQHHPYTDDLFDDELLDDIGMTVLTYKHFYSGNNLLADVYYPVKKEKVTDELLAQIEEINQKETAEAARLRAHWAQMREDANKNQAVWTQVKPRRASK